VAHTAVATAAAIVTTGATPVFVDVDPATYTMHPLMLEKAITPRTKAIAPVHLYGHPADMDPILEIARNAGIPVIEDCAQAHGARYKGRIVGAMGDMGCFSFYPTKNLGAMGDGGAVISSNPELAKRVRLSREYGWAPESRYVSQVPGTNSRLDEMQAAILRVKLRHLDAWNAARRALAARYDQLLPAGIVKPVERPGCHHVYHLYVARVPHRDEFRRHLQTAGIGTGIHYPAPIHQQPAYQNGRIIAHDLTATEHLTAEIVSLPMHPLMTFAQVEEAIAAIEAALNSQPSLQILGKTDRE
jgi:dTDP-4-amino-4,6-dideoxygalactose transaminase